MSNTWGKNITFSIFGESHGVAIGGVLDGVCPGICLDMDEIAFEMARRAPGQSSLTTSRKEPDKVEVLSGMLGGVTTGAPLAFEIRNTNTRSGDYEKDIARPGHSDYVLRQKFLGYNDYRGGGHSSGRITAPLVFAGAVAKQILAQTLDAAVGAHVLSVHGILDSGFPTEVSREVLGNLHQMPFPVLDAAKGEEMMAAIDAARRDCDSVGGVVECAILGLPVGLGSPFFRSFESALSALLFSIPAVKAVEFGDGFGLCGLFGSQANDALYVENGEVKTKTNHNGGINGGITNGMPVVFRAGIKPTASIFKPQETVDMEKMENVVFSLKGRHDPCIVQRALPVVEAAAALCAWDLSLG